MNLELCIYKASNGVKLSPFDFDYRVVSLALLSWWKVEEELLARVS